MKTTPFDQTGGGHARSCLTLGRQVGGGRLEALSRRRRGGALPEALRPVRGAHREARREEGLAIECMPEREVVSALRSVEESLDARTIL